MKTVRYRFGCAVLCMLLASCVFAGSQVYVRVVDQNGVYVPGALAAVFPPSSSGLPPQLKITGGDGKAVFPINPNTPYSIYVSSHGMYPTLKQQFEGMPRTVQVSNSSTVLTTTVTMHRDYMLSSAGKIALTVRDLADLGVNENTLLMAEVSNTVTGEKVAFSGAMWGSVDPDDTVLIPNIPPATTGSYTLSVHVSTHQVGCSIALTSSVVAGQTCAFTVSSSAFVLSQAVERTDQPIGTIAFEGIVTDIAGAGLKDCTVKLWQKVNSMDWGGQIVASELRTDYTGHFAFYNAPSAIYAVSIEKEGYEGFRFEGPYGQGVNTSTYPYTRIWGPGPQGSIQLGEAHGEMIGFVKMHAAGYPDGMPVPFAEVNVHPDGSMWPAVHPGMATSAEGGYGNYYTTGTEHRSGRTNGRTFTDVDGKFMFSGLGHGNYNISVWSDFVGEQTSFNSGEDGSSSISMDSWGQVRTGDDMRVTVSSKTWTTVVYDTSSVARPALEAYLGTYLPPTGEIRGEMSFDVPGDTVYISSMSPVIVWAWQRESIEGQPNKNYCKVFSGILPKTTTYTIYVATGAVYYVKPKSYRWGAVDSEGFLANMENQMSVTAKDFKLVPAGTIRGTVRLPDGQIFKRTWSDTQCREMEIEARGINVMTGDGGNVQDDGSFEIMGLVPGSYQITTRGMSQTRADESQEWSSSPLPWPNAVLSGVTVRAGQVTTAELQLQNGAVVMPKTPAMPPATQPYTLYGILKFPSATGVTRGALSTLIKSGKDELEQYIDFYYNPSAGWKRRTILPGRYDFHLARIDMFTAGDQEEAEGGAVSDHYCVTFISKLKSAEISYDPLRPAATTYLEFNSGTLGQSAVSGAVRGENIFTARDVQYFKESGIDNFFHYIPSVMLYDTEGQLKGYSMALPSEARIAEWMQTIDNNLFTVEWFASELKNYPVKYRIERLPAGDYVAVFETPNYPPMMRKLTLSSGETVFDVNFDSNVIAGSGVSGVVKSTDGVLLPDVAVTLTHRTMTKTISSDAYGAFSANGLPPGTWRMTLNKPGYAPTAEKFGLGQEPCVFANGNEIVMTRSDAILQGTVFAQKMPSPKVAVGAKIVAYNETYNVAHPDKMLPVLTTKTDEQGQFMLEGLVSSNIYKVFVISPGKLLEWQTFGTTDNPLAVGTTTQTGDFVLKTLPPRLKVTMSKVYENGRFQYQFLIESPKKIINPSNPSVLAAPYCRYSPVASASGSFDAAAAVEVLPVIGPEYTTDEGGKIYTYSLKIPVLTDSEYYKMRIEATDGASDFSEDILFGPKIEAKAKKDIKEELAVGGNIPIDDTGSDATQVTLDPGSLTASGAETSSIRQNDVDVPIGGFLSAMPNFNLSRTGSLMSAAMARIKEDIIASDVYEIGLDDAQMNRSLSLNLKFDISAVDDAELGNLLICGYNPQTDAWEPVRGAVTIDPVTGVVSVDVDSLSESTGGAQSAPSAGRAVVRKGMYTINSAASTSQSGVFAVFKQDPSTAKAYTGSDFRIFNFPNPFDLKTKTVTMQDVNADFSQSVTGTMLKYALPSARTGRVVFYVYNLAGELVRELDEGTRNGGFYYYTEWDGRNDNGEKCASGVYFLIAKCDGKKLTGTPHKLAILK